ncbi:hypothetical protein SCOR_03055 [Sulfidibacter corallicola]
MYRGMNADFIELTDGRVILQSPREGRPARCAVRSGGSSFPGEVKAAAVPVFAEGRFRGAGCGRPVWTAAFEGPAWTKGVDYVWVIVVWGFTIPLGFHDPMDAPAPTIYPMSGSFPFAANPGGMPPGATPSSMGDRSLAFHDTMDARLPDQPHGRIISVRGQSWRDGPGCHAFIHR